MNIPNALTILRLFFTIVFIVFAQQGGFSGYGLAAILFTLAAVTDYFDGYIAKKYNLMTSFGKIMDPIADKFLILSALFIFMTLHVIPAWIFFLIAFREIGVTVSRLVAIRHGKVIAAEKEGKIKTVLQITAVSFGLAYLLLKSWPGHPDMVRLTLGPWLGLTRILMVAATAMTVYSGVMYFWKNR